MSSSDFPGTIHHALSASTPHWPERRKPPAGAPNVVVMIVDDMGYSDIGAFGSEIPTPHLDAVAAEGLTMANFHVTPTCSPTRASLLTGKNPHSVGIGGVCNVDPGFPGYASELPAHQPTLAENLRDAGYSTFAIGKWHLCKESDLGPGSNRHSWPVQRGFDRFYGFLEAQTNFFHPHQMYEGNNLVETDAYPEGYYLTDDLTDRAVRMIADTVTDEPEKPFLLYLAHGAAHTPLHAKPEDIAAFRGAYDRGWDAVRAERFARQKAMGLVSPDAVLAPINDETGVDVPAWDELTPEGQQLAARYQEVFAAMIASIDTSVGRIRDVLARLGQLENTIFVFCSDNGAASDGGTDIGKMNHLSAMHKPSQRPVAERIPLDLARIDEIGGPTTWPANPVGWATTANTPFRRHKFSSYRGGNQVSCLMSWPAGLGEIGGQQRHQYTHVTDVMPTLLALAGVPVAEQRHGLTADPLDGHDLSPVLRADEATPHTEQYLEVFGERAFYRDGFEAVARRTPMQPFSQDTWELYELASDPTQMQNLADAHPELLAELVQAWEEAAQDNHVLPMADGTPLHWFQRPESDERFVTDTVLLPELGTVERFRAAALIDGRSFTITVDLTDHRAADSGVLVAHGGQEAGYLLYVEDGELFFAQNAFGPTLTTPGIALSDGVQQIEVRVHAPGGGHWLVDVVVDGTVAVTGHEFAQLTWLVPYNGLDIGIDRRSPVVWELHEKYGTNPWTGKLDRVTYRPGEHAPDALATMLASFREMGRAMQ